MKSRFAALEDLEADEDWTQRLETLKQMIQVIPGPCKVVPGSHAHDTQSQAHPKSKTRMEGHRVGPRVQAVGNKYHPKGQAMGQARRPLQEVSTNGGSRNQDRATKRGPSNTNSLVKQQQLSEGPYQRPMQHNQALPAPTAQNALAMHVDQQEQPIALFPSVQEAYGI